MTLTVLCPVTFRLCIKIWRPPRANKNTVGTTPTSTYGVGPKKWFKPFGPQTSKKGAAPRKNFGPLGHLRILVHKEGLELLLMIGFSLVYASHYYRFMSLYTY